MSSAPTNDQGEKVYCCTIENPDSENVIIIDVDETSTLWNPQDHKAVDPNDKRLYAWLTGETHTIAVGNKKQTYYLKKLVIVIHSSLLQIMTLSFPHQI